MHNAKCKMHNYFLSPVAGRRALGVRCRVPVGADYQPSPGRLTPVTFGDTPLIRGFQPDVKSLMPTMMSPNKYSRY